MSSGRHKARDLPTELKDPLLRRAIKLRTELRRTIAEIDELLRRAETQLKRSRDKIKEREKGLFDAWGKPDDR